MKAILSILSFLFLFTYTLFGQTKIVGAPINVAVLLMNDASLEKMTETCQYYHLTEAAAEDDYTVYNHPDGSKLRFKILYSKNDSMPLVEVITNDKPKQIMKTLEEIGFKKTNSGFERGSKYDPYYSYCEVSSTKPSVITISKIRKLR